MVNDGKDEAGSDYSGSTGRKESNNANGGSVGRRSFLKATGAGAVATGVAGCLGGGGDEESVPLSDRDEIRVGVLAPAPSDNPIGASIANGAKLAAQEINDNDGIEGTEMSVIVKDTKEQPQTGTEKYGELIRDENVDMTTGVFTSEVLLAIMDDMPGAETVHMTTGAATPDASARVKNNYEENKYHFRTGPINAHHLGENIVDFVDAKADDLGWESVAVLVEDYTWTEPVSNVLDDTLSDTGINIEMSRRYASGTEDFNPIYNDVEDSGADAAVIAMAHTGTPAVIQWAQQQRPFEFGGIHVPMQLPSYYGAVEGASAYGVTQNSATPTAEVTDTTVPFAEAYNENYDSYPVYTGYISYDAVNQYASVVESKGDIGADPVIDGLENSSYTGTIGTVEYYGKDHEFAHDVKYEQGLVWPVFQQWQPNDDGTGSQEVIFPDNLATADYQTPPWI
ncbi:ABC transporter substrate-binding protein [Halorientalis salina]|uniref:ABC transporter substrate-binding protein n=1 Tax=Halorientalis salina TaxID=2932266 RepID=UPI0010AB9651|nr:ABC transporter substrate-binding protein [Halorientalis salina]